VPVFVVIRSIDEALTEMSQQELFKYSAENRLIDEEFVVGSVRSKKRLVT